MNGVDSSLAWAATVLRPWSRRPPTIRVERALEDRACAASPRPYAAKSWKKERRVAARIEATRHGLDIRYVVTLATGTAEWLYETSTAPAARPRT